MNVGKSACSNRSAPSVVKPQFLYKRQQGQGVVQILIVLVLVLAMLALAYLFFLSNEPDAEVVAPAPVVTETAVPKPEQLQRLEPIVAPEPVDPTPVIESAPTAAPQPESAPAEPVVSLPEPYSQDALPSLNDSDEPTREALKALDESEDFVIVDWVVDEEVLRKFVVTIDNMAVGQIPRKHSLTQPMKIPFRAVDKDQKVFLDGYNYVRYKPYVSAVTAVDPDRWVSLYRYFYPLMQQAYAELGYPRQSFHDRMLEAVDQILTAPVVEGPIAMVQPSVMYKFADPELENLNDVHKQMLRMGPENTLLLQQYLRNIRLALKQLGHPQ